MDEKTVWIVLLRGINVGGNRKVPMAELRKLAAELGFENVSTHVNSGNLIGTRHGTADEVRLLVEAGLLDRFGFEVEVVIRTATSMQAIASQHVFPEAQDERANLVHVVFGNQPATESSITMIRDYLTGDEQAELVGDEIWIDYANGSARSKVTHDVQRRAFGGVATSRNIRSVSKLAELSASARST